MKKLLFVLAFVTITAFTVTSCKKDKKEEVKEEVKKEKASNELYQCPMDCEKGKSYTEAGTCPKCKMDLKVKKVDMDGGSKEGEKHAENCKCKKDGGCKCAEGKCECSTDKTAQACKKCPEGKCACKVENA